MRRLFGMPVGSLSVVLVVVLAMIAGALGALAMRNRVFVKLGVRNALRRPARTATIVAGLMLGTAIIAAALGTGDTMATTVRTSVLTSLGNTDEVVSARSADSTNVSMLGQASSARTLTPAEVRTVIDAARRSPDVDGVAPAFVEPVAVQDRTSRQNEPRVTLFAPDSSSFAGFGTIRSVGGGDVSLGALRPDEVYLNRHAADDLGAHVGDEIVVLAGANASPMRVRAIVSYDGAGTDSGALLTPLVTGQRLLGAGSGVGEIIVSNRGGAVSGSARTDAVRRAIEPAASLFGLRIDPVKRDGLKLADDQGASFLAMFGTFGTFTISAGILLIFLIFVMLAAERRGEMGTARAVGTQRHHLVQMFVFEGVAYDVLAAAVGALLGLGVALVMVRFIASALSTTGLTIRYSIRWRSFVIAYALGVLLTALVVTASAWRVSRLNVVNAIRNLPDPPRQGRRARWLPGVATLLLGALLTSSGFSGANGAGLLAGVAIVLTGLAFLARAAGVPDRAAFGIGGIAIVVWCLLPFRFYNWLVPGLQMDFSVWVVAGLIMVVGATWAVLYNAPAIFGAIVWVFGRSKALAPVLKTSIAQPLHNRFRTGATVALFTLVVFTLVVGATTSNAFIRAMDDERTFGGGFQIRAETSPASPVTDMNAALDHAEGVQRSDITAIGAQSFLPLRLRQDATGPFATYPVRGLDRNFTDATTYGFSAMARGYTSDRQVWDAVATHPGLAVVDGLVVPRQSNWNFGVAPDLKLHGFFLEDKVFDPLTVQAMDPQTGTSVTLTVIGVLKDSVPTYMAGVSTSQQTVVPFGSQARPSIWYFQTAKGVSPTVTANRLETAFLANGMQAKALSEVLHDAVRSSFTFQWMILGFLALGLIIGVAALGVISARAVVERRQQIGVLRAIGFQQRMVQLGFLIESSFVTLVGIVLGTALGLATAYNVIADASRQPSYSTIRFAPPLPVISLVLTVVFLAALATTWLPARRASRTYPADALRYE